MKIKLLESIISECEGFLLTEGYEVDVTDTDEQRGVYEATYNDGFFVIPFLCAEAIVEPVPVEENPTEENTRPFKIRIIQSLPEMENAGINLGDEFYPLLSGDSFYRVELNSHCWRVPKEAAEVIETRTVDEGRPYKIRVIRDLPEFGALEIKEGDTFYPIRTTDDFYFVSTLSTLIQIPVDAAEVIERRTVLQDWGRTQSTEPQIERDGPKIKLLRAVMSNCGQCKASKDLVLDIIATDNERQIYLCKGPFSEAVTYDVPFSYGELIEEEKQPLNSISMGPALALAAGLGIEQDYKGDSIQETLAAREANYGRFADQAELSQAFKNIARSAEKWEQLPADMKESIDMICHKIARVLNGKGAEYADNWHDIAGYATLVEDRLNENS